MCIRDSPYSADHFRYFAAVLRDEEGRVSSLDENMMSIVIHEPIGVVGQVIPCLLYTSRCV